MVFRFSEKEKQQKLKPNDGGKCGNSLSCHKIKQKNNKNKRKDDKIVVW